MSPSSWGPSMLTKHNTYGVLTLHPLCQAVAKLVGFFEGILTICSCYSQAAQTECLSSYNWLFWIMKFTLLLAVCKFALQSRILDKKKKKEDMTHLWVISVQILTSTPWGTSASWCSYYGTASSACQPKYCHTVYRHGKISLQIQTGGVRGWGTKSQLSALFLAPVVSFIVLIIKSSKK